MIMLGRLTLNGLRFGRIMSLRKFTRSLPLLGSDVECYLPLQMSHRDKSNGSTTFICAQDQRPKSKDQTSFGHSAAFPLTSIRPAAQTAPSNMATATASAATSRFVLNATMQQ